MATYSNILAWRIPWTEEPSRLQSMGPQRVGHDGVTTTTTNVLAGILLLFHSHLPHHLLSTHLCPALWH